MSPAEELPRAFNRQPVWKRIAVLLAGPLFNLIFAVFLYWVLFVAGVPALRPIIGEVAPDSIAVARRAAVTRIRSSASPASPPRRWKRRRSAFSKTSPTTARFSMRVRGVDGGERDLTLDAGDRSRELTQPEALLPGLGFDIWQPKVPAVVATVMPDTAAARAGLKVGDEILKFDEQPIADFSQLVTLGRSPIRAAT